jgi:hypothetical protein
MFFRRLGLPRHSAARVFISVLLGSSAPFTGVAAAASVAGDAPPDSPHADRVEEEVVVTATADKVISSIGKVISNKSIVARTT